MKNVKSGRLLGILILVGILVLGSLGGSVKATYGTSVSTISDTENTEDSLSKPGCSSFVAGKNATVDGCTMSGHTCDGKCDFRFEVVPTATHESGDVYVIDYTGIPGGFSHDVVAQIPQVSETYKYFWIEVPFANQFQVFFGENTCASRSELNEFTPEEGLIDWTQASALALQRAKTAQEAIKTLGSLIEKYGLHGDAESYLITDPNEAWIMEIPGYTYQWVAARIPDDQVCPHANRLRIGVINLDDPDNFMASPRLIQHAIDKGFYNPKKDGRFNFEKVYNDPSSRESWNNRRREWRMFSLLAPSQKWDPNALTYPLSVKPDKKISAEWWINNMFRDYLQDTPFDLTKGWGAGPFGCPERPSIKGITWERAIGHPSTTYYWVSQARSWLPDPIGGVVWFGYDAPYSSTYAPFYVGITETPESWRTGDYTKFTENSARWWFQALSSYSCLRFNEINADIRETFDAIEDYQFSIQPAIEESALKLYKTDPSLCEKFLTEYSNGRALAAEQAAKDMFSYVLAKYADGAPRTTVSEKWMNLFKLEVPKPLTTSP